MCHTIPFKVQNVKIHLRLCPSVTSCHRHRELARNYVVLRPFAQRPSLVLTVFALSGHVNVTGIRGFGEVERVVLRVLRYLGVGESERPPVQIDNSTASCRVVGCGRDRRSGVNIRALLRLLASDRGGRRDVVPYGAASRPYLFPGLVVRTFTEEGARLATCVIFANGKINVLGAKTRGDITSCLGKISALIHRSMM